MMLTSSSAKNDSKDHGRLRVKLGDMDVLVVVVDIIQLTTCLQFPSTSGS